MSDKIFKELVETLEKISLINHHQCGLYKKRNCAGGQFYQYYWRRFKIAKFKKQPLS